MYETEVLRARKRFLFLFVVVFLRKGTRSYKGHGRRRKENLHARAARAARAIHYIPRHMI